YHVNIMPPDHALPDHAFPEPSAPGPLVPGELFPREETARESLLQLDLRAMPPGLRIGTSSFSNDDWRGAFYRAGARPGEYLQWYAAQLSTVEIDATFYAIPPPRTVS